MNNIKTKTPQELCAYLNNQAFTSLYITNDLGTDIVISLAQYTPHKTLPTTTN